MKESGLRIRLEERLRADFLMACKRRDLTAAQVLRAFMRAYVDGSPPLAQQELFQYQVDATAVASSSEIANQDLPRTRR